jgi:hypothetical protein
VQNARAASPEYLARPFEVAEIYHTLLPYRLNRRELGVESVQQYDAALMRLLAGERGYLTGDADMQRAMQEELQQAKPDTAAYRAFATAPVAFAPDAVRQLERDTLPPRRSDAPRPPPPPLDAARATAPTLPPPGAAAAPRVTAAPPSPPPAAAPTAAVLAPMNSGVRVGGAGATGAAGATGGTGATGPTGAAPTGGERCPHCAGKLPEGREVAFCPHCGQNLRVRHCPACSTELEVGWKYCVTCGRNVEELSGARP